MKFHSIFSLRMGFLMGWAGMAMGLGVRSDLMADTFGFTAGNQSYGVPAGAVQVRVKLWGGGGGGGNGGGGGGGFSSGTLAVTPGETLTVLVGGGGGSALVGGSGGFGSGGRGGSSSGTVARTGGGGGRSAIFRAGGPDLVAAAGGGGGGSFKFAAGQVAGAGGPGGGAAGTTGANGIGTLAGTGSMGGGGGTSSAGGAGSGGLSGGINGASGSQGTGGAGGDGNASGTGLGGGGAGGGFFGGGGAGGVNTSTRGATGGGGGGSSLAGPGGSTAGGSGVTPGSSGDPEYAAGTGVGGAPDSAGGPGFAVLTAILAPTVTSPTSAGISTTAAVLGGNVTGDGGAPILERGVVFSRTATNPNPLPGGPGVTKLTVSGTTGVFTVNATGLQPGTRYSFKAFVTTSAATGFTAPVSTFVTLTEQEAWRQSFFGTIANLGNAADTADPDHDGQDNLHEFQFLTDPTSPRSFFTVAASRSGASLTLSFASVPGRTYTLQQSDTLAAGQWIDSPDTGPRAGNGSPLSFTVPTNVTRRLYRVQAAP